MCCTTTFILSTPKGIHFYDKVECGAAVQIVSQDPEAPDNAGREVHKQSIPKQILPPPQVDPNRVHHATFEKNWTTGVSLTSQRGNLSRNEFVRILKCSQDAPDPESFNRCANLINRV